MLRVILLVALVAVGYDAYAHRGGYTRTVVDGAVDGVERLSETLRSTTASPAPAPSAPPAAVPAPQQPS